MVASIKIFSTLLGCQVSKKALTSARFLFIIYASSGRQDTTLNGPHMCVWLCVCAYTQINGSKCVCVSKYSSFTLVPNLRGFSVVKELTKEEFVAILLSLDECITYLFLFS